MEEGKLISLLSNQKTRYQGFEEAKKLSSMSDTLIDKLLECALKENDPSFNGEYVKLCVKNRDVFQIGLKLMLKVTRGTPLEKIGALGALYHVSDEPFIWAPEDEEFRENPRFKDHIKSYMRREEILINEFHACDNIVLKFFFRWALPSKGSSFFKGVPETDIELYSLIENEPELKQLLQDYRDWN